MRKGMLFAGTETCVWVSFDDGDHWQSLQLNLPRTSMRDVVIHGKDLIVATHGRSFWILDDITRLRQLTPDVVRRNAALFQPAEAVRVRRSLNSDTPLPADEPAGENPPDGAIIDYYLGASSPTTLEILDNSGKLVRRFTSSDAPWITEEELRTQTIPPYWVKLPQTLSAAPGMHRWVWDLRYPPPVALEHEYPISAVPHATPQFPLGPLALPGSYIVRLTAGGNTFTAPLTVTLDPRIKTPAAGLAQMFDLQMRLADMLTRSSEAVTKAKAMIADKATRAALKEQLTLVLSGGQKEPDVKSAPAPPPKPPTLTDVQGEIATLYGIVDRADATPTAAIVDAVNATAAKLDAVMKRWEAFARR